MRLMKKIHSAARRRANFFTGRNSNPTDEQNNATIVKKMFIEKKWDLIFHFELNRQQRH